MVTQGERSESRSPSRGEKNTDSESSFTLSETLPQPFSSLGESLTDLSRRFVSRTRDRTPSDSIDETPPADTDGAPADDQFDDASIRDVDPELLDAKRRIRQLLLLEDGELPQAEIVERTRWTSSTISRKLCEMEEEGKVTRYQLGIGKHVLLPEADDGVELPRH